MNESGFSDGEWKLMNLLWDKEPQTISSMVAAMKSETGWTKSTVNSMLLRLAEKGAVRIDNDGVRKLYYPLIERDFAVRQESSRALKKIRPDRVGLLVSTMTEEMNLSDGEIEDLISILRGRKKND